MLLSPFGGLFLEGKAAWALSGCLPTENDYCMLISEWVCQLHECAYWSWKCIWFQFL